MSQITSFADLGAPTKIVDTLAERGVLAGVPVSRLLPNAGLDDLLLVAATETTGDDDIAALGTALEEVLS